MPLFRSNSIWTTGVGKSGIAALYMADLFASADLPATFIHATELLHGGIGRIQPNDTIVGFSASGTTQETITALEAASVRGAYVRFIVGQDAPELETVRLLNGEIINLGVGPENESVGRYPTASFQAQIQYIIYLLEELVLDPEAVTAHVHPGGYLGRQ